MLILSVAALALVSRSVFAPPPAGPVPPTAVQPPRPLARPEKATGPEEQKLIDLLVAPQRFAAMTPEEARRRNALIPYAQGPVPMALPLIYPRVDPLAYQRALGCLAAAIHYEAASEPESGQLAVAQVVLNRVRSGLFPDSVCGVVFQGAERSTGCQFTFTCDGSLRRTPNPVAFARARRLAEAALSGRVAPTVGWATHYHTLDVLPLWSTELAKTTRIGNHIFYRIPGRLGASAAFARPVFGAEPDVPALASLGIDLRLAEPEKVLGDEAGSSPPSEAVATAAPIAPTGPPSGTMTAASTESTTPQAPTGAVKKPPPPPAEQRYFQPARRERQSRLPM